MKLQTMSEAKSTEDQPMGEGGESERGLEPSFVKMKDQEDFYRRLIEFHKHKNVNTAIHRFPSVNGRLLDLRGLYSRVVGAGGWERVCEKNRWDELAADTDPITFKSCLNGAHALKLIYIRYLSLFEKFDQQTQFTANGGKSNLSTLLDPLVNLNPVASQPSGTSVILNPALTSAPSSYNNLSDINGSDDPDLNRRKFSHLLELTPMNYNYFQHSNPSTTSSNSHTSSAFEPILLSLLCGLPNEVDFIINTLIHLSADDKNPLKMAECPRIVDALLAHVGFFGSNDKYQLRNLYDSVWNSKDDEHDPDSTRSRLIEKYATYGYSDFVDEYMDGLKKTKRRCFVLFWHNGVRLPDVGEDLSPDINNLPPLLENILPKLYNNDIYQLPSPELLNIREGDLVRSIEYRRLEQIMIVLNNLSFEDSNADFMANKSTSLLEFLVLASWFSSREPYVNLKRHSLDILTNIAKKLKLKRLAASHRSLLVGTIHHLIVTESDDQLDVIRALEILSKLCGRDIDDESSSNDKILCRFEILNRVLTRMEYLLTSQDVLIVLHALECLYNMTQSNRDLDPPPRLIPILVNFLTLDISHFGNQAVDNPVAQTYATAIIAHQQPKPVVQPNVMNGKPVLKPNVTPTAKPAAPVTTNSSLLHQTLQQQHALANSASTGLVKIQTSDDPAKNTLSNWLVTSFQPDPASEIPRSQLYAHYQHIAKVKGWSILTIPAFFETLNSTFPFIRYNEEANTLTGIKLDPKISSKKPEKTTKVVLVVNPDKSTAKKDDVPISSLLSPPPTISVINQGSPMTMPLLTPPSPPPPRPVVQQPDKDDSKQLVNGNNEHSAASTNPTISEILNQNEDSTSSMSSSSSTMSSATSSSKSSSSSSSSSENLNKRKMGEETEDATGKTQDTEPTRAPTPDAAKKSKPTDVPKPPEIVNNGEYMCEWNNCNRMFPNSKTVYNHAYKNHLLTEDGQTSSQGGYLCLWSSGCDQIRRQKWSLVNHLMERHCNENAMKTAIMCRQRGIQSVIQHQPAVLNYSSDAALIAIQRNQKIRREDFYASDEGPITKSIRLLAALGLRNLAKNSDKARKVYEAEIANVAFDLMEASNALTSCLWYLSN